MAIWITIFCMFLLCSMDMVYSQFISQCEELNTCNSQLVDILSSEDPVLCRGLVDYIICAQGVFEKCPDIDPQKVGEFMPMARENYNSKNCSDLLSEKTSTESPYTTADVDTDTSSISSQTKHSTQNASPDYRKVSSSTKRETSAVRFTTSVPKENSDLTTEGGIKLSTSSSSKRSTSTSVSSHPPQTTSLSPYRTSSKLNKGGSTTNVYQTASDKTKVITKPTVKTSRPYRPIGEIISSKSHGPQSTEATVSDVVTSSSGDPTGFGTRSSASTDITTSPTPRDKDTKHPPETRLQRKSSVILPKITKVISSHTNTSPPSTWKTVSAEYNMSGIASKQEVYLPSLVVIILCFLLV